MTNSVKVLLVDDSPTMCQFLKHIIDTAANMQVIGIAHSGQQGIDLTHKLRPTVIIMDIVMPGMDGLETTREIMRTVPTPIVMVTTSLQKQETDIAFRAIRLGALTVLQKPIGSNHPDYLAQSMSFISTIRAMADVKVIYHRQQVSSTRQKAITTAADKRQAEILVIAVSTGGPAALAELFKSLPTRLGFPIVVAQHISVDFLPSLVEWLSNLTPLPISIAQANEQPRPGHIYFAPGDGHLSLSKSHKFEIDRTPGRSNYMPSGDILLESVARNYGSRSIGLVLTGMGTDGAQGLKAMYEAGAYTIAQDEETSVVFGMPQEAFLLGATHEVLPINKIATRLISLQSEVQEEQTHG